MRGCCCSCLLVVVIIVVGVDALNHHFHPLFFINSYIQNKIYVVVVAVVVFGIGT